jgi:general secretion pathway protein A
MYATYFGLQENPFNLTPDPKYLYLSQGHNEALDHLLYGINERKGFVAIIGGIGTGKTTLCRALLNQVNEATKTALIFNTCVSESELLETINHEFGIYTPRGASRKQQVDHLNRFLLRNFAQGGNAVLVFDEAQNLSPPVLEQIRMLSNLETEKEKLIQTIFVGQPELKKLLGAPNLRQLHERIAVWYDLKGLNREEVQNYIEHRLVVAGARGNVKFSKGALNAVHAYSEGIPRRINAVCDRALLISYCRDESTVKKATLLKAIKDIQGDFEYRETRGGWLQGKMVRATVMSLAFIVASLGGWHYKDHLSVLLSGMERPETTDGRSFVRKPITSHRASVIQRAVLPPRIRDEKRPEPASRNLNPIALDKRSSLAGLFKLFNVREAGNVFGTGEVYPGLFSFEGAPQLYRMFKKPHRLRIKTPEENGTGYLLIRDVGAQGAIALDADGRARPVSEEYILANWDGEMSWVYPYEHQNRDLAKGMSGQGVLRVQQMLQKMGYKLTPSGLYDDATLEEVKRFQRILGLEANGIVGTKTKALLYQMSG